MSLHGYASSGGDRHEAVFLLKEVSFNLKSIQCVCVYICIFVTEAKQLIQIISGCITYYEKADYEPPSVC